MLKHVETCLHHSEIFWINKICMASVVKTALKVDQVGPSWTAGSLALIMATMRIALSKYSCSFEHHPQQNHEILEWLEWLEWLRFELFKQTWQTYRSIEEQSVNLLLAAQQPGTLWVVSPWFACCQQVSSQSQSQQSLVSTSASWHPEFISNSFPLLQRRVLFMFSPQRRFCLCISWKGGVSILVTPAPMI